MNRRDVFKAIGLAALTPAAAKAQEEKEKAEVIKRVYMERAPTATAMSSSGGWFTMQSFTETDSGRS